MVKSGKKAPEASPQSGCSCSALIKQGAARGHSSGTAAYPLPLNNLKGYTEKQ